MFSINTTRTISSKPNQQGASFMNNEGKGADVQGLSKHNKTKSLEDPRKDSRVFRFEGSLT